MTRARTWKVILMTALVAAACGGDGGEVDAPGDGSGNQDQGGDSNGGDTGGGDFEVPQIDPSSMPPAGEARVEVDGQTFVFRQADMLEGPFTCEVRDNGVTVNFQSDGHDLLLQGAVTPENKLIVSATVVPEEGELRFASSSAGDMGAAATDAPYVLYVGRFDSSPKDNLAQFDDVGEGTIAVTCP